jgi:hypothetical protein
MAEVFEIAKTLAPDQLADRAEAMTRQVQDLRDTATGALVTQIEASPLKAIAVAAGVGYLASLLISIALSSRTQSAAPRRAAVARRSRSRRAV